MYKFFITATDTDAGKTFVAQSLVKALTNQSLKVAVFKPVSAGCDLINNKLVNEDAKLLFDLANCNQSLNEINPIAFKEPIAPHIAAKHTSNKIAVNDLSDHYKAVIATNADYVITEGAGGWRLPLGNGKFLSEFVQNTKQQVVLVVNMKLGCLNHAVLTYQAILADGLECVAWVANCFEGMDYLDDNIDELTKLLDCPMLAKLDKEQSIDVAANKFNVELLTR